MTFLNNPKNLNQETRMRASKKFKTKTSLTLASTLCLATLEIALAPLIAAEMSNEDSLVEIVNKSNQNTQTIPPTKEGGGADAIEDAVENRLNRRLEDDGLSQGWDETKNRFAQTASYTFNLNAESDLEDYFAARQTACLGALLRAQIDIATF